ncbi:MAG: TonB-dependent receptor [Gammaproteobacteria bacterium]|nr:TonB-dependent receptor [Gammaproteobacteria bacterium]
MYNFVGSRQALTPLTRAPTLIELYATSNPAQIGNPDLKPVTIRTYELASVYKPLLNLKLEASIFYHELDDIIAYVSNGPGQGSTAQNALGQLGNGFEISTEWLVSDGVSLYGYYAYQKNEQDETSNDSGFGPRNKLLVRGDWQLAKGWSVNAIATRIATRVRENVDPRPPAEDYTRVDLNLIFSPIPSLDISFKVNNVFDEEAYAPDDFPNDEDIALPGRNSYLSIKYAY